MKTSVAIPKLFGLETEYGFYLVNNASNPVLFPARLFVEKAIRELGVPAVFSRCEYERLLEESLSFRRFMRSGLRRWREWFRSEHHEGLSEGENRMRVEGFSGAMLANGARFYVDCEHPEYSTPECISARDLVRWSRAGHILALAGKRAMERDCGVKISVSCDNSDRRGSSFASHENYCVDPESFSAITHPDRKRRPVTYLETFLVTRQIFAGAGKVGCEDNKCRRKHCGYQISQRADFIRLPLGSDTMIRRAIVNTRDRAYADERRFRRLHVILGDANICDVALWLRVGVTAMLLKALENRFTDEVRTFLSIPLANSVRALKDISHDPTLKTAVRFRDGKKRTALEVQREFQRVLELYFRKWQEPLPEELELLRRYDEVLNLLESGDFEGLIGVLDWPTKLFGILEERLDQGVGFDDIRMSALDQDYHNLDPAIGGWARLEHFELMEKMFTEDEVRSAVTRPPENTRAYLRGECVRNFSERICAVSWNRIFFKGRIFSRSLLELPNPFSGGKDEVGFLFDSGPELRKFLKVLPGHLTP